MADTVRTQSELLVIFADGQAADSISPQDIRDLVVSVPSLAPGGASSFAALTGKPTTLSGYGITDAASLASPALTGTPTMPTAAPGTNTTQGATTAFVTAAVTAGTAGVASFSGRTGTVVPTSGDYTFTQIGSKPTTVGGYGITDFNSLGDARWLSSVPAQTFASLTGKPTTLSGYGITDAASLASPAFTGTPTAPTATAGTNTTQLATTAFVTTAVSAGVAGVASFNGRTGTVVPTTSDYTFAQIATKPTTIAGYGITDFNSLGDARWLATSYAPTWTSITSKPTTVSGFGITDAATLALLDGQTPYDAGSGGNVTLTPTLARKTQKRVLSANAVITVDQTAIASGSYFFIDSYQNGTGGFTRSIVLASGSIGWLNGGQPTIPTTANDGDRVVLYNNGTTIQGWLGWSTVAPAGGGGGSFASLTGKPTTLSGYGITDAVGSASPAFTGTATYTKSGDTVLSNITFSPGSTALQRIGGFTDTGVVIATNVDYISGTWINDDPTQPQFAIFQHLGNAQMEFRVSAAPGGSSHAVTWLKSMILPTSGVVSFLSTPTLQGGGNIATELFVTATYATITNLALKAPLASPTFTGTPTLPTGTIGVTQTAGNSTTALATTAFVATSFAALASPTFTGTPTLPTGTIATTQTAGDSSTKLATTAFVTTADNLKAPLASPTFTGTPTLPTGTIATTQAVGDSSTKLATTAFVQAAAAPAFVALTDGATITWATSSSTVNNASVTIAGNRTLAITGATNGETGTLIVTQDGTGSRTLALPSGSKVVGAGGGAITLSTAAGAVDVLSWTYNGTNYFWTYGKAFT